MKKRGKISLEALVKFIPHFVLIICLIAALAAIYKIALPKEQTTPAMDDLKRVAVNIRQLGPGDFIPVFTTTHGHSFVLYRKNYPQLPNSCSQQACLCVFDAKGVRTCKKLGESVLPVTENGRELCPSGVYEQCKYMKPCVLKYAKTVNVDDPGDSVYVCRSCTEVIISDNKAECLRHVQSI